ncbi:MAG: hypothetical protein P8M64_04200 [Thermodesulfobacteriota bacteirum]|nr:hypothetical protein [Thermodesulfobacteriota bacterium]
MIREKQNSKAAYLAKYDKSLQSLGFGLAPYTVLALSFVAILIINL